MSRLGMDSRPAFKRLATKRPPTRFSATRGWVIDRLGNVRHERRVIAIATALVEATSHLHNLTVTQRRLLRLAVLVHDVGRCVDDKHHPAIGAEMILDDETLPLKRRQRRALAYLTLYHRGQVPPLGKGLILRESDDRQGLQMLLGFLRAADCLDSRSLPSPSVSLAVRGSRIRIHCQIREDSAKARRIFTRRKKFRLLEEMLGCQVDVIVECNRRLQMVA